ncbi:MAG TPA: hypothetical protein VK453_25485 [Micromonosporaceae bacterium]|nr:hypothetical protein [Micromonosporaceae bacterium]
MNVADFADWVKKLVDHADNPKIAKVQTHTEVGRWEHPCGVVITFTDGWRVFNQLVASGGPPRPLSQERTPDWADRPAYVQGRAADDKAIKAAPTPAGKPNLPAMKVREVQQLIVDLIAAANHPDITSAETKTSQFYANQRPAIRVKMADDTTFTGYTVGYAAPGSTTFAHQAHQVPKEWF